MSSDGSNLGDVMTNYEAQHYIEHLSVIDIKEYGSPKWYDQDEIMQKLNMQAHITALLQHNEFIMEQCCTYEKVKVLIYDLLSTEVWKQKVLPLVQKRLVNLNSYRSYITIYHEAVIVNMLEIIMYHRDAVEGADNFLIELIDYCYVKLVYLTKHPGTKKQEKQDIKKVINKTKEEELKESIDHIEWSIAMMCLSIIRYISDYAKHLPISIIHHLLCEVDIPCILVPLIEQRPWLRENTRGEREKFENSKWVVVEKNDYSRLPKYEGQVWISIYNLFMEPECRKKYELNDFRKNNLLRLRKYMNEILMDQIPNLTLMLRALEELSMMNVNTQTLNNPFIVQSLPEVRESILKNKNWKEIAEYQLENFFKETDKKQEKEDMSRMAKLYGPQLDGLLDGYHCEKCQKPASKRCSKCKSIWYCSRDCQLNHWKDHKPICAVKVSQMISKQTQQNETVQNIEKENIQIIETGNKVTEKIKDVNKEEQVEVKETEGLAENNNIDNLDTLD